MPNKIKLALATAVFFWASAFVGIRADLTSYSPGGLALLRYIIASICMGIIFFRLPQRNQVAFWDACALFVIGALSIGVYAVALNQGELTVSSGMASFIIGQAPIFTAIFSIIFLGEKLILGRVIGFIVSVLGVLCITIGEKGGFKWDNHISYILLATLIGSVYSIAQKFYLQKYAVIEATTYVIWGGTLFLLIYIPSLQHDFISPLFSIKATLIVAYLGIFPGALGYVAWSYALTQIPASRAVSFLYFMPFIATFLGWLCLNEKPTVLFFIGGLLAVIGVWLVNQSYQVTTTRVAYAKNG